jgi:RecB family exonuclease
MMFDSLFTQKPDQLQPFKTSPGKLRLYLQCPLKYKMIHIDDRRTQTASSPHLAFDSALNRMLESVQKIRLKNKGNVTVDMCISELNRVWNPGDFTDVEDESLFRADAEKAAANSARWFNEKGSGDIATYQNKPAIAMFAPWYPRPLTLWTRLDRVERMPGGDIRLIDFKSGAREETAPELRTDLGVRIQAMAGRELFGKETASIAIVYIRSGNTVSIPLSELDLDFLAADVTSIVRDIQNKRFEPKPGPLCSVCDFMEECRGWRKKIPWKRTGETRDAYRNRLRLSYSKMSLFERCPRAYHLLYNEKKPPKPQPFFSFGSCIHAVMENFYDPASRDKPSLEHMLSLLEEQWRFFRAGYRSQEEETSYYSEGVRMLELFHHRFVENKPFKPATHIEKYFELPVGKDAVMTGFIDRIDTVPNGGSIILDYKTEPTDRTQQAVDKDLQLTLYYWAGREFLNLDIRQLGLFMMKHDKMILTSRTPDDIPPLIERINDAVCRIRAETAFAPRINTYCLSCDHLSGCPLEDEIRADQSLRSMEFSEEDFDAETAGDDV